ncbi:hypothetical protein CR513_56478, partial [Mucuna pruriens]
MQLRSVIVRTYMKPSSVIVRAFDGSQREVMGKIEILVNWSIHFQNHFATRVVTSSLHQKLKFVIDDKLVIIMGEEDILVRSPTPIRYIEVVEEALETSF